LTIISLLTLALGIGASTTVFSVVNAILIKPLPYPNGERVVLPWRQAPKELKLGYDELPWGQSEFKRLEDETQTFQEVAAFQGNTFNLTGSGDPTLLEGLSVSAGFFAVLGIAPELGRVFTAGEDQPGHDHEVILSYSLWRDKFGQSNTILGSSIDLNGYQYSVIGIMPPGFNFPHASEMPDSFDFPRSAQIWVPLPIPTTPIPFESSELAVMALLKPGVSIAQAQSELNLFASREDREFPKAKGWFSSKVTPLRQQVTGEARRPLLLLLSAVGLVLLIACSNVASLLLAGSVRRKREFTLRAALGASRSRIIRQLLTESISLAVAGGILGMACAVVGIYLVKIWAPSNIPRLNEVSPDLPVFFFAFLLTVLTGILFGLAPAFGATNVDLVESLKEGGQKAGGSRAGNRIRNVYVVVEVAIALVLVIAASLLVRTFSHLLSVDPGFNPERVFTFELSLPVSEYPNTPQVVKLYQRVLHQIGPMPGIVAVGVAESVPMGGATENTIIKIPDHPTVGEKAQPLVDYTIASPGYFAAVGTPLIRGRDFLDTDTDNTPLVTVINNAMATKFWPGEDAIGKRIIVPSSHTPLLVVGISANIKRVSVSKESGPEMYVPYTQNPWPPMSVMQVLVRTQSAPKSMISNVTHAIHAIDPQLPVAKVTTLTEVVSESLAQSRFSMALLTLFGILALVLASIGMYGVISYSVVQRTREIGVRMAMGAQKQDIFRMILRSGAKIGGWGIGIGLMASAGLTQLMSRFLYGVKALDIATFTSVPLILFGIVLLACYMPAIRAMRSDPVVAIRHE